MKRQLGKQIGVEVLCDVEIVSECKTLAKFEKNVNV